jgi:hypothetical protein
MLPFFDLPQRLPGGFHFPSRMTVLPLTGRAIALVSPIPFDEDLAGKVAALGEVKLLIAPNLLHHLYLADALALWPGASVLAPGALRNKRPDLRIDRALEEGLPAEFAGSVRVLRIDGAPKVDEFVFFHEGTRTLVVSDLVFNVTKPKGFVANVALFVVGCHGRFAQSRAWRFFVRDRAAAAVSARALLAMHPESLIMAHGDVVASRACERLEQALAWMCAGDALTRRSTTSRLAPR